MKKLMIGFVMFLLAVSAWAYIPPANLTVSGEGLSITGGTQAVNGTGTNITISKVASADYSTSAGSAGTASTAGYASTAGAASTALTAGVAAYSLLTAQASSAAFATSSSTASTSAYSVLTATATNATYALSTGVCTGNANTVTNGLYSSNTYSNPSWLSSVSYAVLSATASTCATISGTLGVANGGTNITSYSTGDVLYASGTTTLSKLKIGSAGQGLVSRGGIPSWEALAGSGTVTQVNTGAGLTGGPITTTGTISIDSTANISVHGIKAGGTETLKFWTYTHVVTHSDYLAGNCSITITSVTLTKIRAILPVNYNSSDGARTSYAAGRYFKLVSMPDATDLVLYLDNIVAEGDTVSVTIIEAN